MEYGKFDSVEALMNGYAALEKEFTRKCQELTRLQNNNNAEASTPQGTIDAEANALGTNVDKPRDIAPLTATAEDTAKLRTSESSSPEGEKGACASSEGTVPETSDKPVSTDGSSQKDAELLSALKRLFALEQAGADVVTKPSVAPPSVMHGGGNVSMALPSRPKTLKEASEMAKKLFE